MESKNIEWKLFNHVTVKWIKEINHFNTDNTVTHFDSNLIAIKKLIEIYIRFVKV